jgi:flagellar protein FlaG
MSNVDNNLMVRVNPIPRVEGTAPAPAPKSTQSPDAMSQKIREVSASTGQVNAQITAQRTESAQRMNEIKTRIDEAIRTLNESAKLNPNKLQFSVDSVSNKVMVVVTDEVTGETVRQVPAEAILRVAHNIEAMKGLLFDKVL